MQDTQLIKQFERYNTTRGSIQAPCDNTKDLYESPLPYDRVVQSDDDHSSLEYPSVVNTQVCCYVLQNTLESPLRVLYRITSNVHALPG